MIHILPDVVLAHLQWFLDHPTDATALRTSCRSLRGLPMRAFHVDKLVWSLYNADWDSWDATWPEPWDWTAPSQPKRAESESDVGYDCDDGFGGYDDRPPKTNCEWVVRASKVAATRVLDTHDTRGLACLLAKRDWYTSTAQWNLLAHLASALPSIWNNAPTEGTASVLHHILPLLDNPHLALWPQWDDDPVLYPRRVPAWFWDRVTAAMSMVSHTDDLPPLCALIVHAMAGDVDAVDRALARIAESDPPIAVAFTEVCAKERSIVHALVQCPDRAAVLDRLLPLFIQASPNGCTALFQAAVQAGHLDSVLVLASNPTFVSGLDADHEQQLAHVYASATPTDLTDRWTALYAQASSEGNDGGHAHAHRDGDIVLALVAMSTHTSSAIAKAAADLASSVATRDTNRYASVLRWTCFAGATQLVTTLAPHAPLHPAQRRTLQMAFQVAVGRGHLGVLRVLVDEIPTLALATLNAVEIVYAAAQSQYASDERVVAVVGYLVGALLPATEKPIAMGDEVLEQLLDMRASPAGVLALLQRKDLWSGSRDELYEATMRAQSLAERSPLSPWWPYAEVENVLLQ
ncbi:hypothetical protein BC828DRAFT_386248 [Blastocladiella britannica]|nr:hypothetical protein BC828DRAFT_386248 [Blastocladiella britannica]